jgi:hypothetical protein
MTENIREVANPWKAGCGESRTPGLEGGVGKRTSVNAPCSYLTCATKRGDGMGGKPHRLYQQEMSRWGVASRGCTLGVKELPLKGPVRRDASRQEVGLG